MPIKARTIWVYGGYQRLPRSLVLAMLIGVMTGCAHFHAKKTVQYQTVAANGKHDTETACEKHAKALPLLKEGCRPCDYAKAERLLNEALVADVTYGPAHNSLGMLYYQQGKLYLAAWEFEYAAKLMPSMPEPYNNLGLVYEKAGKYDEAISYYAMALSHSDGNPEVVGNLVRTRMIVGDRDGEIKDMVSDLALNHPNPRWQKWARDQVALTNFHQNRLSPANSLGPLEDVDGMPLPIEGDEELSVPELQLQLPEQMPALSPTAGE